MLDAKDGFGKPVRRTGSQGYPNAGEGRDHRVFTTHTRSVPLLRWPLRELPLGNSSYLHGVHGVPGRQRPSMTGADSLKALLFC